jgi:hypothetical protein
MFGKSIIFGFIAREHKGFKVCLYFDFLDLDTSIKEFDRSFVSTGSGIENMGSLSFSFQEERVNFKVVEGLS